MKKIILFGIFAICSTIVCAQNGINSTNIIAIIKQVNIRAKTFCDYVVAVGTSIGQPGSVSNAQKNDIIRNRVPGLFWDYYEAPRIMKTTNGPHGQVVKTRKMSDYFVSLKAQSKGSLTNARVYELRFVGFVGDKDPRTKGFHFERNLSDGCQLWSATIRIKQTYRIINPSAPTIEGKVVEKEDIDFKDYKVYAIVKPNGKVGVFLGDVTRAQRR